MSDLNEQIFVFFKMDTFNCIQKPLKNQKGEIKNLHSKG